jgi:hypothetical protein
MVMNFLMTAAPSMHMHGISQQASNLGIQWHVIAMYGPGFFTGKLINRFGAMRIPLRVCLSRHALCWPDSVELIFSTTGCR